MRDVASRVAFAALVERAGQEHDAVSRSFENLAGGKIVLLRQNFSRRHQRDLVAVFNGDDRGLKGDDGFARSHVALQQTPHGAGRLHVGGDFFQHSLLGGGGMKRQYLLDRLAHAAAKMKGDSGLRLLLPAFEFEAKLDEKKLIENHPYVSRGARRLQVAKAFAGIGPVRFPQRLAWRHQAQMGAHRRGDWIGKLGIQIFQRPSDNAPEPAWRKLALAGRFVDRNDASDLERGGGLLFSLIGAALFVDVAQNLELRLHNLQLAVAVLFNLAVERQHLSGLEAALEIRGVKPQALQLGAALADGKLEDGHTARAKQSRVADLGDYRRHFSGAQFGDRTRVQTVFVAEGQVVQQVVDGSNILGAKHLGQARTDAFHILHWSGRFQHRKRC